MWTFLEKLFGLGEYRRPFANSPTNHTDKNVGELREMRRDELAMVREDYAAEISDANDQFHFGEITEEELKVLKNNARKHRDEALDRIADHEVYSVLD